MDLKGSLVDNKLIIHPTKNLIDYIQSIQIGNDVPLNIVKLVKGKDYTNHKQEIQDTQKTPVHLNSKDIENINKIKSKYTEKTDETEKIPNGDVSNLTKETSDKTSSEKKKKKKNKGTTKDKPDEESKTNEKHDSEESDEILLATSDIDWLYYHLADQRKKGIADVPHLHTLLQGSVVETPKNEMIKRNPILEARCVKLRAQQEAREYRKMTKTVDNVRMRFPEDSISYQLKQLNRQLIAIGQFIISIFAGFLFGFRGVEWMVGNLDFGFRLLLGVMCALVIALAEIYFLAKKLNEELNIPETTQLGGPTKFADPPKNYYDAPVTPTKKALDKEHQE